MVVVVAVAVVAVIVAVVVILVVVVVSSVIRTRLYDVSPSGKRRSIAGRPHTSKHLLEVIGVIGVDRGG